MALATAEPQLSSEKPRIACEICVHPCFSWRRFATAGMETSRWPLLRDWLSHASLGHEDIPCVMLIKVLLHLLALLIFAIHPSPSTFACGCGKHGRIGLMNVLVAFVAWSFAEQLPDPALIKPIHYLLGCVPQHMLGAGYSGFLYYSYTTDS